MLPATDDQLRELGRKAFHMNIEIYNVPAKTERERKLIDSGYAKAKLKWFENNRPKIVRN